MSQYPAMDVGIVVRFAFSWVGIKVDKMWSRKVQGWIAPDVDAERDQLIGGLVTAGMVQAVYQVTGVGPTLFGRNGGGDRYFTDGEIHFARLVPGGTKTSTPPAVLDSSAPLRSKDHIWHAARNALPN
jgi:hypothetical protein